MRIYNQDEKKLKQKIKNSLMEIKQTVNQGMVFEVEGRKPKRRIARKLKGLTRGTFRQKQGWGR